MDSRFRGNDAFWSRRRWRKSPSKCVLSRMNRNAVVMCAPVSDASGGLVRAIGRWGLTALVIHCVIGAGIFGFPSRIYALVGGYSPIAFIACGLLAFLVILCFAEAGSRF